MVRYFYNVTIFDLLERDGTMRLLLQTRKPVLCTAHSEYDLKRDLAALDAISSEEGFNKIYIHNCTN